jgi:HSP20 family molecular chaperone IbpA
VDIFEEPDAIRLVAEVPGVKPADVKISVEANLLTVKGTKEQVAEQCQVETDPAMQRQQEDE